MKVRAARSRELIAKGRAISVTEASPPARRARMARRVGSARAEKVALSWSGVTVFLNSHVK